MVYDLASNVIQTTDAKSNTATIEIDPRGRTVKTTDRIGAVTTQRYGKGSELLHLCDGDNQTRLRAHGVHLQRPLPEG